MLLGAAQLFSAGTVENPKKFVVEKTSQKIINLEKGAVFKGKTSSRILWGKGDASEKFIAINCSSVDPNIVFKGRCKPTFYRDGSVRAEIEEAVFVNKAQTFKIKALARSDKNWLNLIKASRDRGVLTLKADLDVEVIIEEIY